MKEEQGFGLETVVALVILGLVSLGLFHFYRALWTRPREMRRKMERQGIKGPPPSLLYGNILEMKRIQKEEDEKKKKKNDNKAADQSDGGSSVVHANYSVSLFPYLNRWSTIYGPIFMYSTGSIQLLYVSRPDIVKEIGLCKSLELGKPSYLQKEHGALFGQGILTANGDAWVQQRKIIAPELFMDKIKHFVNLIGESTIPLSESWECIVKREGGMGEIVVEEDLRSFSADVISRTCFGSNYSEGKEVFLKLRQLQKALAKRSLLIGIPSLRYLPTKRNREIRVLDQEIRLLILKLAKEHKEESTTSRKNLLESILEGANIGQASPRIADDFIIDNCKNIYFAGHETTATTASWCLMLLASHPEWQARVRAEVVDMFHGQMPEVNMLSKMKTLTMVIQETLRLYPPAAFVIREAFRDMKLGDITLPKGVTVQIPISVLHHDPDIWGPGADEFNPERFARGISGACRLPHAYLPFGIGARTCLGQNLAMVELKIVLSLLLSKFMFSLSPRYIHSPAFRLTIEPGFGVPLILRRV